MYAMSNSYLSVLVISNYLASLIPRPPCPTPFPYTTLFRSVMPERFTGHRVVELLTAAEDRQLLARLRAATLDRKSTRLNSSHITISYAVFCLKKKKQVVDQTTDRTHIRRSTLDPTSPRFAY